MHSIAALFIVALQVVFASASCSTVSGATHTFYGWPDNDPPGNGTAYDCGRNYQAGGIGTYEDPLTFASAPGEFDICEIIYDPYTKKYLRMEDKCAQCAIDWESGVWHIDVWTGSSSEGGDKVQTQCEIGLTPAEKSQTILRKPSEFLLPVDSKSVPKTVGFRWKEGLTENLKPLSCLKT